MRVLLYSAVLYLLGITIVLYLKPQLMFRQDGRWKEFGVNGADTTYFPFWLFCITWAVVAYAVVRMLVPDEPSVESVTVRPKNIVKPPRNAAEPLSPLPVPTETPTEGKPGYYKLDETLLKEKGTPLYVYVGPEPPADA